MSRYTTSVIGDIKARSETASGDGKILDRQIRLLRHRSCLLSLASQIASFRHADGLGTSAQQHAPGYGSVYAAEAGRFVREHIMPANSTETFSLENLEHAGIPIALLFVRPE